ncbi:MAG TPA: DNA methyltransferase [bacterium]|nr:DNA methyltransferase [bacterium]
MIQQAEQVINREEQDRFQCEFAVDPKNFGTPLSASVLNIEAKSRSNPFPWRGQFSPQLVESLFRAYAPSGATILDPFMGSGTVLVEAARLGLAAHGYEVNPAAYLLARIYELCTLSQSERHSLLDSAKSVLDRAWPSVFELPLFRLDSTDIPLTGRRSAWIPDAVDPAVRMLLEAFVVLLDDKTTSHDSYAGKWAAIRAVVDELPNSSRAVHAWLGDARALRLQDHSVDFVLSSPPYINVFNYHHNSRAGIESLGWKPLVVARSEIGSNRKFRQNRFLTVVQYCIDMALALEELFRVCSREARIILVLGRESNVQKTPFFNGSILRRLATDVVGMRLHQQQERVFLNRFGQNIYEDLLHLTPERGHARDRAEIMEQGRSVGREMLVEALDRVPSDRRHYLHDAIAESERVEASPILEPTAANGDSP